MSRDRLFDVAILGAGPAGLMAALACSRDRSTVVATAGVPTEGAPVRVDCVPSQVIALLAEFGINPQALGAHQPAGMRSIGWSTCTPDTVEGLGSVHLERPRLERALLDACLHAGRTRITVSRTRPTYGAGVFVGNGWRAPLLIDASGTAAVMAARRVRPQRPWTTRTWILRCPQVERRQLEIAALREGYVFRLATAHHLTVGVVGAPRFVQSDVEKLEDAAREAGCGWILEDLPSLARLTPGWRGRGSVQWSELGAEPVLPVGDAGLAPDPLSSQGVAMALTDAMAAAAVGDASTVDLFRERHQAQVSAHLRSLREHMGRVRWAGAPTWQWYVDFLAEYVRQGAATMVAVRSGRLQRVA